MTYRTLSFLLLLAVVGLSFALWHRIRRHEVADYTKQDSLLIRNHRDSLTHVILATQDTLNAVRHVLDGKMRELATARLNTSKTIKAHEQIHFVPLTDSSRVAALRELYPSIEKGLQ